MNLNKLALVCSAVCAVLPEKEVEVSGIHCDSRQIQPGDLFVALGGTQTNGKHYIGEALRRGAVAVLTSFPLPLSVPQLIVESNEKARTAFGKLAHSLAQDPSQELKSYGVTGTNGKTTITYMLSSIFGQERCGILGTTGNRFQDEEEESTWTTPSPVELVRFLSKAKEKGMTHCCFEASSHALAQERLSGMRMRGGSVTNLTPEHLD
jgi:UDP-N-acetylmuramoyl-L-alanyl-D-glutamate--2,6-diaminopimelate ligase